MSEVTVAREDLHDVSETLAAVHSFLEAHDICEQYRKLDNRQRRSPLTNLVRNTLVRVEGMLADDEAEDDVPSE